MSSKSFIKTTLILILSGIVLISTLTMITDPFFHYHAPLNGFPYQVDNQLSQNPGMAKHFDYDSVLLGSSMTVNFRGNLFKELMGKNLVKLPYNGAYPKDISNIFHMIDKRQVTDKSKPLKTVYLGMDLASWSGDINETKYPIPDYLYDDNPFNDVSYILNKDVILDYIVKPVVEWEPTDLSEVYSFEKELSGCYSKEYVLSHYTIPERVDSYFPEDMFEKPLVANLEANLLPLIDSHKDVKFVIFFPPYSILYWYEYLQYNQFDAVIREYKTCMEILLSRENVILYFFPGMEDVVTDLNIYADTGHYRQSINDYMTECFENGKHRIHQDDYEKILKDFKEMVVSYDYDKLLYTDKY